MTILVIGAKGQLSRMQQKLSQYAFGVKQKVCMALLSILAFSCTSEQIFQESSTPNFDYYAFLKSNNPGLEKDIIIDIGKEYDKDISIFIPHIKTDSLIASFSGSFSKALVDGVNQISNETINDFRYPITYNLIDEQGTKITDYTFRITGYNGLPRIFINTRGGLPIVTKDYLEGTISIDNCPAFEKNICKDCQIKGRGNATFGWDKKPYKVKLAQPEGPFGFPAKKEWVLLALWNDKSLLRESLMVEVSKRVGEPFTINSQHVDLYINSEYRGTYLFVDQVERGPSRVDIDKDGFFIEDDLFYLEEPQWFTTASFGFNYSFKYPKSCTNEDLLFIKTRLKGIEETLISRGDIGELIDVHSFAQFFIVNELLGNWEPNLYYYLSNRSDKLKMGPLWDFEWSLGLAENGNRDNEWGWYLPPQKPRVDIKIWENKKYFSYLIKEKCFVDALKDIWIDLKPQKDDIIASIQKITNEIKFSQSHNFQRWPILGTYTSVQLVSFDSWNEEVDYVIDFFNQRFEWMDSYLSEL